MTRFRPSIQPRARRPSRNASKKAAAGPVLGPRASQPTRAVLPAGCASAASGVARRPPVMVPRKLRRVTTGSTHRQREGEGGPAARLALDPDPASMQLDELLRQGQAQARAFLLARLVAPHLAELLEDGGLVLGGDPDPGVGDGDLDRAVPPAGPQ